MRNLFGIISISAFLLVAGFAVYEFTAGERSGLALEPLDYRPMPILTIVKNDTVLAPALKQMGIKELMEKLVKESNGGSTFDCHQEAHNVGRVGYELYKEKAFEECDANCHSGCYHGAMEKFLNEKGTLNLSKNIDSVCGLFKTSFGNFECLHGVGHGLLAYVDYDMPETVEKCKELKDNFSTQSCYGGMFMENVLTAQGFGASERPGHKTEWLNKTDPHFPCNALDKNDYELRYQCYQMQTSWMLSIYKYDFAKVVKECLKASDDMVSVCFKSYGRDAAGHTLRNPQKIQKLCDSVPKDKDYYDECVVGAVNVIVDFWGPSLKDQAAEFCRILDERGKRACYNTLVWRLPGIFHAKEELQAACQTLEEGYRPTCLAR